MKSNRAVGNGFETELCELLFGYGFWSHNLKQDSSGQPADVIAVKNKVAYLIDCKVCSTNKGFDLRRVEDNQELAMEMWEECGNGQGWFAIKVNEDVFMLPYFTVKACKNAKSYMSIAEMNKNILKKLTSRKFILAAITAIVGIITLIVGDNEAVKVIAGAAMTIVPTVVYCLMEGVIDAKSVKVITEATADAAEQLGADKATVNMIEQVGAVGEVLVEDEDSTDTSE